MRDRLIHSYDEIDLTEVWKAVTMDVPVLREPVRKIADDLRISLSPS
jgi:uncharacterized protein with HEPN domain